MNFLTNMVSERLAGNNSPGEIKRLHDFVLRFMKGVSLEEKYIFSSCDIRVGRKSNYS